VSAAGRRPRVMSSLGSVDSAQDKALNPAKQGKARQKPQLSRSRGAGEESPQKTLSSLLAIAQPPVSRLSELERPVQTLIKVSGYATHQQAGQRVVALLAGRSSASGRTVQPRLTTSVSAPDDAPGKKNCQGGHGQETAVRLYWLWRNSWKYAEWVRFSSHARKLGTGHGVK
jgi:hypothetical protein